MKLTINEIAKIAKVTKGTVSKALNDRPGVSPKKKEEILNIANKLGFEPHAAARALARKKTSTIGLVIPHEVGDTLNGSYWSTLTTAVSHECNIRDYNLMLFSPKHEGDLENTFRSIFRQKNIDGLLVGSESLGDRGCELLSQGDLPYVLIGQIPGMKHSFVDIDNFGGAKLMTDHMIDMGHKKIAFISGPEEYFYNRERIRGYKAAVNEKKLQVMNFSVSEYNPLKAKKVLDNIFKKADPDGIFIGAGGDFMLDILQVLREESRAFNSIPFTVFDDYRFMDFLEIRITAVRQPLENLGATSASMLFRMIDEESIETEEIVLPTELTIRKSC